MEVHTGGKGFKQFQVVKTRAMNEIAYGKGNSQRTWRLS